MSGIDYSIITYDRHTGQVPAAGTLQANRDFSGFADYTRSIFEVQTLFVGFYGTGQTSGNITKRRVMYNIAHSLTGFVFSTPLNPHPGKATANPVFNYLGNAVDDLHPSVDTTSMIALVPNGLSSIQHTITNPDATHILYFQTFSQIIQVVMIP